MHQTLKTQRKAKSNELITLWQMFDDVVSYEEDPSGTTAGISAISTKFNDEWKAYRGGPSDHWAGDQGAAKGLRLPLREDPEDAVPLPHRQDAAERPLGRRGHELGHGVGRITTRGRRPTSRTTSTTTKSCSTNSRRNYPRSRRSGRTSSSRPKAAASMSRNFSRRPAARPRTARSSRETHGTSFSG